MLSEIEATLTSFNFFFFFSNGRPGSKSVTEQFKVDWGTYMSSHCDVVYIKLDVRGARGQSDRSIYHQLGGVEVQDQVRFMT